MFDFRNQMAQAQALRTPQQGLGQRPAWGQQYGRSQFGNFPQRQPAMTPPPMPAPAPMPPVPQPMAFPGQANGGMFPGQGAPVMGAFPGQGGMNPQMQGMQPNPAMPLPSQGAGLRPAGAGLPASPGAAANLFRGR